MAASTAPSTTIAIQGLTPRSLLGSTRLASRRPLMALRI
jgi:hypothetical protein